MHSSKYLRRYPEHFDKPALVYDLVDNFSHFYRQGLKRRKFYKGCKYHILVSKIYDTEATNADELFQQISTNQVKIADSVFSSGSSENSSKEKKSKKKVKKSRKKKIKIEDLDECPF